MAEYFPIDVYIPYTGSFSGSLFGDGRGITGVKAAPAGPNGAIQFNNGGVSSGSTLFTFEDKSKTTTLTGSLKISGSTTQIGNNALLGNTLLSGSITISGSSTIQGTTTMTGSLLITGSTTQTGNNILIGNTLLSGSIIISGSSTPGSPTASVQIYGDIRQSGYHRFDPVSTNIDTSISASYIYVSGSTQDLYFSQNSSGYNNVTRLRWLEGTLYTGLLHGGLIGSASSTVYTISSGSGIIVNINASYTRDPYPTIQFVTWGNLSGSIAPLSASFDQTFIAINSSSTITTQGIPYSDGQFDTLIPIGIVLHQNHSTINGVKMKPSLAYGWKQRSNIFVEAFGPLKLSGYALTVSGSSTGSLLVGSGTAFADGANYSVDPNNPSYASDSGTTVSKIYRYWQSGSNWVYDTNNGAGYGAINPGLYASQSAGGATLTAVPGGGSNREYSIQRCYWFPNSTTKAIVVYYGNATYETQTDAAANIQFENFTEAPNTAANAIYLGALIVRNNANFTDSTSYIIDRGGLFRAVGGGGGGGGSTTPGGSSTQIQYNNGGGFGGVPVLTYDGATLSATGSFSGSFTGSLFGTASWATNALTASYVNPLVQNVIITGSVNITGSDNLINISPQASGNGIVINNSGYLKFNASAVSYIRGFSAGTLFAVYNSAFTNIFNIGTSAANYINTGTNFIVGTTTDIGGRLSVRGSGATSATTAFRVENTNASASLVVLDNNNVGIGTISPTASLHISASDSSSAYSFLVQNGAGQTLIGVQNSRTVSINAINTTNGDTAIGTTNGSITFNQGYNNTLSRNALTFYNGGNASTIQGFTTNPGIAVGYAQTNTNPNTGSVFTIRGTVASSGSGVLFVTGSSATKLFTIDSDVSSSILVVSGSGNVGIGTGTPAYNLDVNGTARISSSLYAQSGISIGGTGTTAGLFVQAGSTVNRETVVLRGGLLPTDAGNDIILSNGQGNATITSGTRTIVDISRGFAPTSGTGVFNTLLISPPINQTGGANGITRGIYVNPTLTSAANFRAIETTSGSVLFQSGSVTSTNGFTGSLLGTASYAIAATTVVGSYFAQGKLSANQLIATGSDVIIQFTDDYDPRNWWNTSTYRFTPNVTGYYNVSFGVWFEDMAASSSVQVNAQARKNGNSFMIIQQPCNVGTGISLTGTKIIFLNGSTDYLDFTAYNGAFVSKNIQQGTADGSGTWFAASLLTQ